MSMLLKIDKEGRVTIPKDIREFFGLKAGDDVLATETSEGLVLNLRPTGDARTRHESLAEEMRKDWGL
jgi:AbrB family looped-hinge helix DNA binding protein